MARKKIEEPMEQVEAQAMAVQPDKKQRKPRETKPPKAAVMKAQEPAKEGKIGRADVQRALDILRRYKDGKAMLESRAVENEQWWKLRHWSTMSSETKDSRFESAWLFNMLLNKHADAMDNYPEAVILPREQKDMEAAWELSEIVPVVMDMNGMEDVYDKAWWSKLKNGTGIYGVFWNSRKENGLGDIEVREIDVLNVYWEPGVEDIQNSPNFFCVEAWDKKILEERYPQVKDQAGGQIFNVTDYVHEDNIDKTNKVLVIDWYYKIEDTDGRVKLHYAKMVNDVLLFATENEEEYKDGLYDHGKYPFVFDVLFPMEGSPAGFGYIDVAKKPQMVIDSLNEIITQNAWMSGKKRFFVKEGSNINTDEFADWSKPFVHVAGSLNEESIREFSVSGVPAFIQNFLTTKVEELKETSGNNEIAQGGTMSGVTSGTAIAAMQEQQGKLSRDMIRASYRNMVKVAELVVELIRQFYTEPRYFRITGKDGRDVFKTFTNATMLPAPVEAGFGMERGERRPVYDIKVKAQRANPFNTMSQNDLMIQLFGLGMFNPQLTDQALMVLGGMRFEGKEDLIKKVQANGTMYQQMMQMQEQMQKMAAIIDSQNGTQINAGMSQQQLLPGNVQSGGGAAEQKKGSLADQARAQAASVTAPT